MDRERHLQRVLNTIMLCGVMCMLIITTHDASADGYPGANLKSGHILDFCTIIGPGDTAMITVGPVPDIAAPLAQSCGNLMSQPNIRWDSACQAVLTPDAVGGWSASFHGTGAAYNLIYMTSQSAFPLGGCGCYDHGGLAGAFNAGVGDDAKCYCAAGTDWDPAIQTCVRPKYHVRVQPPLQAQCDSCDANSVAEPINPSSGAVFNSVVDVSGTDALPFKRFYNSTDSGHADLSGGWRHSYSRSVTPKFTSVELRPYTPSPDTSSQFDTAVEACQNGFLEIRPRMPSWSDAYAQWSGTNCQVFKGFFVPSGYITVYSSATFYPPPAAALVAADVTRDDGQRIRFVVQNGVLTAPPTVTLKLQPGGSGYTVIDANDHVESYDGNGVLQTVTSRTGVQTMSYDTLGRLSTVTDSFGHSLVLGYDAKNRVTSVTRQ